MKTLLLHRFKVRTLTVASVSRFYSNPLSVLRCCEEHLNTAYFVIEHIFQRLTKSFLRGSLCDVM